MDGKVVDLGNKETFMRVMKDTLEANSPTIEETIFSFSPNHI